MENWNFPPLWIGNSRVHSLLSFILTFTYFKIIGESTPCFKSSFSDIISQKEDYSRIYLEHFLQINSNKEAETDNISIEKLKSLLCLFINFNKVYEPSSKITIDEIIAPFMGRFKYLTYNPQKPTRWGGGGE